MKDLPVLSLNGKGTLLRQQPEQIKILFFIIKNVRNFILEILYYSNIFTAKTGHFWGKLVSMYYQNMGRMFGAINRGVYL